VIGEVPSLDDRLRARVGIATGLAVVGMPAVLGEPVELANHLLALAAQDSLVISASCQRLTGGLLPPAARQPLHPTNRHALRTHNLPRVSMTGSYLRCWQRSLRDAARTF
jgi:class 3 adenylate cyclase